jgi:predicted Zn-dependent peptidase
MPEYHHATLDNALELVVAPLEYLHSVEIICYFKVGSRYELAGQAGLSHFVEHMLFRGNARYPSGPALERAFEQLGSSMNAGTDAESTSFFARVHPRKVKQGLELFSTMLRTPKFLHLETERSIVLEEAMEDFNEEGEDVCADNCMSRLLWGQHSLGQPIIGTPATIRAFTQQQVHDWYARHYVPDNLVISVAGPVSVQQVRAAVEDCFGDWRASGYRGQFLSAPESVYTGPKMDWVRDSDSQLTLQMAWRTEGRKHKHAPGLRVLRRMLGEGGASLLMQKLREDSGLTYSVDASLEEYAECGCLSIDLATDPGNLLAVVEALLAVVERVRSNPEEEVLKVVACNALNYLDFSRDNVEDLAGRYGWGVVSGYMRTLEQDLNLWRSVSPAAVQEAARYCLNSARMGFVCIGPWQQEERDKVESLLRNAG